MAQFTTDITCYSQVQRLVNRQGVGARSVAVQNKFVKRLIVWVFFVTAMALFYVWIRVQVLHEGYMIEQLRQDVLELSKTAGSIEADIAKLKSPSRLEDIAKKQLNMSAPTAEQIVLVREE